jgi:hypothetical protein
MRWQVKAIRPFMQGIVSNYILRILSGEPHVNANNTKMRNPRKSIQLYFSFYSGKAYTVRLK